MAFTVVNHSAASDGANPGLSTYARTITATTAGNALIVVSLAYQASAVRTITGVSDGTNAFTQFPSALVSVTSGSLNGCNLDVWYLPVVTAGRTTVTLTYNTATQFKSVDVFEVSYSGTFATDGVVGNGLKTGTGTTYTGEALTTSAAGFLVAFCVEANTGQNPKSGNVFTSGGDVVGTDAWCSYISPSAGTYTPEWLSTISGGPFATLTAGFKETGGSSAPVAKRARGVSQAVNRASTY